MNNLEQFKAMIRQNNFLVLDTETTGLHDGEICQIAIIDNNGQILLDTYVKTIFPIPTEASRIHRITDAMVATAPTWADITTKVQQLLTGRDVVIYNAVYDRKMMHQSAEKAGLPKVEWKNLCNFHCAMEAYAVEYGDWNDYHQSYRWQRLSVAAERYGISTNGAHSALADCRMTLAVCLAMAQNQEQNY